MAKKLIRIPKEDIQQNLSKLISIELDAIETNGVVTHGKLDSFTSDFIFLIDSRYYKHKIPIINIHEIIFDQS